MLIAYLAVFIPTGLSLILAPEIFFYVFGGNLLNVVIINYIFKKFNLTQTKHIQLTTFYLLFISIFAILSYHSSITTGSPGQPYIPGGDGDTYFRIAKTISGGNPWEEIGFHRINYQGYTLILGYVFKFFGVNLFAGLLFNYTLLIVSLLLISLSSLLLTNNKKIAQYTLVAAILIPSFASRGISLGKDVLIIFSFSLFLFTFIRITLRGLKLQYLLSVFISIAMTGITRTPFIIVFIFIMFAIIKMKAVQVFAVVTITVGLYFLLLGMQDFSNYDYTAEHIRETALETDVIQSRLDRPGYGEGVTARLMLGHAERSFFVRLLYAPIATMVQFVMPFAFWNTLFISDHPTFFISGNLNIIWYGYIGVIMLFAALNIKRISNSKIKKLLLLGILFYVSIAFMYGGTIPRYATPALVFVAPALGYTYYLFKSDIHTRKKLISFFKGYYFLGAILFVIYLGFR